MNNEPEDKSLLNPSLSKEVADEAEKVVAAAKNCCGDVSAKLQDGVVRAQERMRQHPLTVVLSAVAFGAAVGCLVVLASRKPATLRERFVDDPVQTTRDTLYAALAPVAQRLHDGYGTARDGAVKAMHRLRPASESWSDQIGRVGSNLKFW